MPVNKLKLRERTKRYTMQDYYDGKCSKEGFTLDTPGAKSFAEDEAAKNAPPQTETTSQVESSSVADETQPTEAVQSEKPEVEHTSVIKGKGPKIGE